MKIANMLMIITFLFALLINNNFVVVSASGLIEVYQWNQIDFYNRGRSSANVDRNLNDPDRVVFPDRKWRTRREILTSRHHPVGFGERIGPANSESGDSSYIAYNNVPMGVTHFRGKLFVTVPRRRTGIPSTLNYIDMYKERARKSPKLTAYPDFATNELKPETASDSNRLVSVYRTTADECSRLWFIDTGILEYPNNLTQVKRPAIWVIDLNTDTVQRRFEIPESIVSTGQGLASISVDTTSNTCNDAYAYIPDLLNNQLYVYSYKSNRIWAFRHNYFNFDPLGGDLTVGGQTFRWDDGIFSTTLGPRNPNGYRDMYFHAMASTNEFVVSTEVLQNEQNSLRSDHGDDFRLLGSRGSRRQSTMHEYDKKTGTIFYAEIQNNGVGCWKTSEPFTADNHGTVDQNAQKMIYPSDLTIDENNTLWVMTNSMPIFIYSNLDPNIPNFRIWKQDTSTAVKNTVCA